MRLKVYVLGLGLSLAVTVFGVAQLFAACPSGCSTGTEFCANSTQSLKYSAAMADIAYDPSSDSSKTPGGATVSALFSYYDNTSCTCSDTSCLYACLGSHSGGNVAFSFTTNFYKECVGS